MRRCVLLVVGVTTLVLAFVGSASATFPGSNGPIGFRDDHPRSGIGNPVFGARPDGGQVRVLSQRPGLSSDWRPDGRRIAFDIFQRNGSEQIATMRRTGSDVKVITSGKGIHEVPSYSPSGRRLVFDASPQDPSAPHFQTYLWVMRADGSHAHRLAMASTGFDVEPWWAPNGRWIAFGRLKPTPHGQLQAAFLVSTTGTHRVHQLTPWSFGAEHPTWSPDSHWILYNSPDGTIQKIRPSRTGRQSIITASDGFGGTSPGPHRTARRSSSCAKTKGRCPTPQGLQPGHLHHERGRLAHRPRHQHATRARELAQLGARGALTPTAATSNPKVPNRLQRLEGRVERPSGPRSHPRGARASAVGEGVVIRASRRRRDRLRRAATAPGPAQYDQPETWLGQRTRISSATSRVLLSAEHSKSPASAFVIWPSTERAIPMATSRSPRPPAPRYPFAANGLSI